MLLRHWKNGVEVKVKQQVRGLRKRYSGRRTIQTHGISVQIVLDGLTLITVIALIAGQRWKVKMFKEDLKSLKCNDCLNGKYILSENGWHIECCLSKKAWEDCYLGVKDKKVVIRKSEVKMTNKEAREVLLEARPDRPRKTSDRRLQQAIDVAVSTMDSYDNLL